MATSHVGPSGSQTDFESALAALDAELKNRGTGGLDQDLLLPPELVQNSGSKEFFCYAIAVLIGSINKYPSGLLRTHLRQLERAYGYETEDGDEVFSTRTSTGVARGVSWDEWDGADWMPAASGRRVPDPRSLVVIRADDLDTVMSLLEDLTKEFFDLDDWIKKRSMDLSAALTTLVGPSVVSVLASSPHLMAAMGIIVLVYFHRLQHHLEDRRRSKPTNCIVERADRMSQRSGHVSLDALVKTYAVHERQATPKGVFALCQNQRQDTRENCPFRSVSFIGGGINLCLFAEPSHLDGREGSRAKIRRAMAEAVAEGRYRRRIDKDANDYYRAW
jgi:hypothetical protein